MFWASDKDATSRYNLNRHVKAKKEEFVHNDLVPQHVSKGRSDMNEEKVALLEHQCVSENFLDFIHIVFVFQGGNDEINCRNQYGTTHSLISASTQRQKSKVKTVVEKEKEKKENEKNMSSYNRTSRSIELKRVEVVERRSCFICSVCVRHTMYW